METTAPGLTSAEAARRLAVHGPNELVPESRLAGVRRVLAPLADPMALILLVVGGLYFLIGETRDAAVTLGAFLPMVALDWALGRRRDRTLAKLRELTQPSARLVRDGAERTVPVRDIVPGDLLLVEEGDVVPADARLLSASDVLADESSLTGESEPVAKEPGATIFAGATIVLGRGSAEVVETASRTRHGKIGALVATIETPRTPLQETVARLVKRFAVVAVLACGALLSLQLARGLGWTQAAASAASLALVAMPEEFPLVFTLFLSLGVLRMSRRNALIRRWAGVETLGSTSVVCCDKTGTLTEGRLRLTLTWSPTSGEQPPGDGELLRRAVLACEPEPYDLLEKALVEGAGPAAAARGGASLVKEHAFARSTLRMSHIWRHDGALVLAMKGSVEGVLAACRISPEERARAEAAHHALAAQGMKVLAVASRPLAGIEGSRDEDEADLAFDGLVGFVDPPRAGVREALERCRDAGIRVLMLTGDHPDTARAIAGRIGLAPGVVTGDELAGVSDAELPALLARRAVVARANPEQKHRIVRALRAAGEVVAMTGDGTDDAPALKEADIGVAMGRRGTAVARAAATMILLDDAFPTIVVAVEEGRRIFDNLRKSFVYLVAFHVPIIIAALAVPALGWPLLILPAHAVWLELIVHPLSAFGFEAEPAEPLVMRRRPRRRDAPLLSLGEGLRGVALGLSVATATMLLYGWATVAGLGVEHARGLALSVLVLSQIGLVLTTHGPTLAFAPATWTRNKALAASCCGVVAVLAGALAPGLRGLLRLEAPRLREWPLVVGLAAAATLWAEIEKLRGPPVETARPRRVVYPLVGLLLAQGAPAGYVVLRCILAGAWPVPRWIQGELASQPATYAYLVLSTSLVFLLLGVMLGRKEDRLRLSALTDALTGIANRRQFDARFGGELVRATRYGTPLALLLVDVDNLKALNAQGGHEGGDDALRAVAETLARSTRSTDLAARVGGDEFAVVAPMTTSEQARELAARIREALALRRSGRFATPTVSIGIADATAGGRTEEVYAAADRALFRAKQEGRDRAVLAS